MPGRKQQTEDTMSGLQGEGRETEGSQASTKSVKGKWPLSQPARGLGGTLNFPSIHLSAL